jgi:hypothetical protein
MRTSLIAILIALFLSVSATGQKIQGVWSVTEVTTTGTDGSTRQATQPSMYLFTKTHYSIIVVASSDPRPDIDVEKATAEELRTVFVNNFIANAGTYEVKDGKLTMRPTVAKSPGFMQPGTFSTMSMKIEGNMLTLVSDSSNNGPAKNPVTFKLKRVE